MDKKILDVTCGSRTIWFDKNHPAAIYCDIRDEEQSGVWTSTNGDSERKCVIHPDVQCDFTDLPFPSNSFTLVVFDPPHLRRVSENAWMRKKYGQLGENWREVLHDGFHECMRVLKPDGVLIFKWNESQIPAADVWAAIGERPLFGHHSGKKSQTFWGCFMKLEGAHEGTGTILRDAELLEVLEDLQIAKNTADQFAAINDTLYDSNMKLAADRKELINKLCQYCGKYKHAHEGACDGCKWREM